MAAAIFRGCVGNCRRIIPTLLRKRTYSVLEGFRISQPVQSQRVFPTIVRWQSVDTTDTTDDEAPKKQHWWEYWMENYFAEVDEHPSPYSSEEEKKEREAMLERVQEMYFARPPVMPDLDFYKESFELLMKYKDRAGVVQLWDMMIELKVDPDDEITERVEKYLKDTEDDWYFD